jgi:hypothetical protein
MILGSKGEENSWKTFLSVAFYSLLVILEIACRISHLGNWVLITVDKYCLCDLLLI